MASPTFGNLQEFDSSKEEWLQYEERLQHFFDANGIKDGEEASRVFVHGRTVHVQAVA